MSVAQIAILFNCQTFVYEKYLKINLLKVLENIVTAIGTSVIVCSDVLSRFCYHQYSISTTKPQKDTSEASPIQTLAFHRLGHCAENR